MGQHDDLDDDGIADRGAVIDPALIDRQSLAFRENDEQVPDDELAGHAETVHAPLGLGGPDAEPIRLPEDYDADGWDARRDEAKSPAEAQAALAARIDDPQAPDGREVEGVEYRLEDELGQPNSGSSGGTS